MASLLRTNRHSSLTSLIQDLTNSYRSYKGISNDIKYTGNELLEALEDLPPLTISYPYAGAYSMQTFPDTRYGYGIVVYFLNN